jgi:hypothetical protein
MGSSQSKRRRDIVGFDGDGSSPGEISGNDSGGGDYGGGDYGGDSGGGGGCFLGSCQVLMGDSTTMPISELKRGDSVACFSTENGRSVAKVAALLVIDSTAQPVTICHLGQLSITSKHPIIHEDTNEWVYPKDSSNLSSTSLGTELYNILLKGPATTVFVEGVRCATLGSSDLPLAMRHPFWSARELVKKEMLRCNSGGYHAGRVEVQGVKREGGRVSGFNIIQPSRPSVC